MGERKEDILLFIHSSKQFSVPRTVLSAGDTIYEQICHSSFSHGPYNTLKDIVENKYVTKLHK